MDDLCESGGRVTTRGMWFSGRAVLLHLTTLTISSACVAAGWWQATRALDGNALSWFYSVEWPAFAVVAVVAWWHLIHEDPDQYRARREQPLGPVAATAADGGADAPARSLTVGRPDARLATVLAVLVGIDSVAGVATVVTLPFSRPSGLTPHGSLGLYLLHAVLGVPMLGGAAVLIVRVRRSSRLARLTGWVGGTGIGLAGLGGLLTVNHPLRLAGMALMLLGAATAAFGYAVPSLEKLTGATVHRPI